MDRNDSLDFRLHEFGIRLDEEQRQREKYHRVAVAILVCEFLLLLVGVADHWVNFFSFVPRPAWWFLGAAVVLLAPFLIAGIANQFLTRDK